MIFVLDYAYIRNIMSLACNLPRVPSEIERQAFKFEASDFKDSVVTPWYRDKDQPSFYYVAEVILFLIQTIYLVNKQITLIDYLSR